ncbi:MAG TPA: glycosyltransferase family 2 protein, partial [bacterium]|nr:glycosyltransferase family 2 protein [bacterium]
MTLSSAEVRKQSLSVFFPCHNEADNIGALVDKTVAVLRKLVDDFEVIIVNDGSKDKTREVADALAAKYPEVRAVHHEVNKGYGGAVWTGLRSATKQLV